MAMPNQTPNLFAGEPILPYSMVYMMENGGDFTVYPTPTWSEYTDNQVCVIGVTDGSVSSQGKTFHALAGQPVTLQRESIVLLRAQVTLPTGAYLEYEEGGGAFYYPPPYAEFQRFRHVFYQSLEPANAGEIFQAMRIGCSIMHFEA
jgi:hypothetical protein